MSFLSQPTQFFLFLSLLVSFLTAGLGYFNKRKLDATKQNWLEANIRLAAAQETLAQISQSEVAIKKQFAQTTDQLQQASASLFTTREELKKSSIQITDLSNQLTAKELQIADLKSQTIAQENKIKELTAPSLSQKNAQAKREAEFNTQIAEQKTLVAKLQNQVERAQSKIQEYIKKDTERKKLQLRLGLEGKILAVNQAWNFVVLSIGDKNGVLNNVEMLIKRGSRFIGKVRITSVEPSTSIADIIPSSVSKGQLVQVGDSVIYDEMESNDGP